MSPPGGELYNYKCSTFSPESADQNTEVEEQWVEWEEQQEQRELLLWVSEALKLFSLDSTRRPGFCESRDSHVQFKCDQGPWSHSVTCRPHESRCWSDTVWVIKRDFSPADFLRVNRLTNSAELRISEPHGLFVKTQQGGFTAFYKFCAH